MKFKKKRIDKKSQMQAQIFIYVMVLVVGAGILIYGYTAVKGFKKQADDVLYMEFENTMKNDFKSISYESTKQKTYSLPGTIVQVCFKGKDAVASDVSLEQGKYQYPLIYAAIGADGKGTTNNVFIYPKGDRAFNTGVNLEFADTLTKNGLPNQPKLFKCFNVQQGTLKIKITGKGNSVLVTEGI